jgi:DNA-binding GntR family transcriptional regulator
MSLSTRQIKQRQPLALQVSKILRDLVLNGDFKPGDRLNETLIAAKLGVSRSPIREALKVLESENLVINRGQRGTFVRGLSEKEVKEIYSVLCLISEAAIREAVERFDEKKEKELRQLMRQQEKIFKSSDPKKVFLGARRFHAFIIEASENDLLKKIYDFVQAQEHRCRLAAVALGGEELAEANREHLAMAEALLGRDATKAEALNRAHLQKGLVRGLKGLSILAKKGPTDTIKFK